MPVLSTFAGAALRTYGRGIEQVPAYVPAGAIIPFNVPDITTATIPTNWTRYTGFDGRYVLGTSSNNQIEVTGEAAGNVNVTLSTSSAGDHTGTSSFLYAGFGSNTATSTLIYVPVDNLVRGNHTHTGAWFNCATAQSNTASSPFITTSTQLMVLPANAVVFRKIQPSSSGYSAYRFTGDGHYYGSATTGWADRTASNVLVGATTSAGSHTHDFDNAMSFTEVGTSSASATYQTRYAHLLAGEHTHSISVTAANVTLRSKELKAWTSPQPEPIEYGMIIMYRGNLSTLPAGWRVCNGSLGTPDMTDYFLGYTANELHDSIISTSNTVSAAAMTISTDGWNHTHQNVSNVVIEGFRNLPAFTGPHSMLGVSHTHTFVSSAFGSFTTTYQPAFRRVAFIQYKGI